MIYVLGLLVATIVLAYMYSENKHRLSSNLLGEIGTGIITIVLVFVIAFAFNYTWETVDKDISKERYMKQLILNSRVPIIFPNETGVEAYNLPIIKRQGLLPDGSKIIYFEVLPIEKSFKGKRSGF